MCQPGGLICWDLDIPLWNKKGHRVWGLCRTQHTQLPSAAVDAPAPSRLLLSVLLQALLQFLSTVLSQLLTDQRALNQKVLLLVMYANDIFFPVQHHV